MWMHIRGDPALPGVSEHCRSSPANNVECEASAGGIPLGMIVLVLGAVRHYAVRRGHKHIQLWKLYFGLLHTVRIITNRGVHSTTVTLATSA